MSGIVAILLALLVTSPAVADPPAEAEEPVSEPATTAPEPEPTSRGVVIRGVPQDDLSHGNEAREDEREGSAEEPVEAPDAEPDAPVPPAVAFELPAGDPVLARKRRLARPESSARIMKGHAFLMPQTFDSAFVTAGGTTRLAVSTLELSDYTDSDGNVYDLSMLGFDGELQLSLRLHKAIGLFIDAGPDLKVGLNNESSLRAGAVGGARFGAGAVVRLFRIEETGTQLAIRGRYRGWSGTELRPGRLWDRLNATDPVDLAGFLDDNPTKYMVTATRWHAGGGALAFAQAVGRHVSLQVAGDGTHGTATIKTLVGESIVSLSPSRSSWGVGVALTGDLHPIAPIALMGEYRGAGEIWGGEGAPDPTVLHRILGGLYYTGHPDLAVGLVARMAVARTGPGEPDPPAFGVVVSAWP